MMPSRSRLPCLVLLFAVVSLLWLLPAPAASAAAPGWTESENISDTPLSSRFPSVAADNLGNVHVVWSEHISGQTQLYYTRREGHTWTTPAVLTPGIAQPHSLAVDRQGDVHLVYLDSGSGLAYYRVQRGGIWSSPVAVSNTLAPSRYALSLDAEGTPHLALRANGLYYTRLLNGTWTPPALVADQPTLDEPRIALGPDGTVHLAWYRWNYGACITYYARRAGSSWNIQELSADRACEPEVAVDSNGNPHVAWIWRSLGTIRQIRHTYWTGSEWTPAASLYQNAVDVGGLVMTADRAGRVHLAWANITASWETFYLLWDGTPRLPVNLSNNSTTSAEPAIAVDSSGFAHVVWRDDVKTWTYWEEIFYATTRPPTKILRVPSFKQGLRPYDGQDPIWERDTYDHATQQSTTCPGPTIAGCGCAMTSATMLLNYYGVVRGPLVEPVTPRTVNTYFAKEPETKLFTDAQGNVQTYIKSWGYNWADFDFTQVPAYSAEAYTANVDFVQQPKLENELPERFDATRVRALIDAGNPVALRVTGPSISNHWVVVTGYTGDDFTVNDPLTADPPAGDPSATLRSLGYTPSTGWGTVRHYRQTHSDFSTFVVSALAPAQVLVTAPDGQRTGFDPSTASILQEIPNSAYVFSPAIPDATGDNPPLPEGAGVYQAILLKPATGAYQVEVVNPDGGHFLYVLRASNRAASTAAGYFDGEVPAGQAIRYTFNYEPDNPVPVQFDTIAPTTTASLEPDHNAAGWNTGPVVVTLSATDNAGGSGVQDITYRASGAEPVENTTVVGATATLAISNPGETTVAYFATDNAGNAEAEQTVIVRIDGAPPIIDCAASDEAWHSSNVGLACTAGDLGSGLANPAEASFALFTQVPEGVETAVAATESRTICDRADNCATAGPLGGNKIDRQAPAITVRMPASTTYRLGETVVADYGCADGGSGVAVCAGPAPDGGGVDTSAVGMHDFVVEAADLAGNSASASVTYRVVFAFDGFFAPVDNPPAFNAVKAGSAIPVKFSLGGDFGLALLAAGYPASQQVRCNSTTPLDEIEETIAAGNSALTYDPAAGRYQYVWKTSKDWAGTCRQFVLKLSDGSYHYASFEFK